MKCVNCGLVSSDDINSCPRCGQLFARKDKVNNFAIGGISAGLAAGSAYGISKLFEKNKKDISIDDLSANIEKNIEEDITEEILENNDTTESTTELNEESISDSNVSNDDLDNRKVNSENDINFSEKKVNNNNKSSSDNNEIDDTVIEEIVEENYDEKTDDIENDTDSLIEKEKEEETKEKTEEDKEEENDDSTDTICTCTTKCSNGDINMNCPVCNKNYNACEATEEKPDSGGGGKNNYSDSGVSLSYAALEAMCVMLGGFTGISGSGSNLSTVNNIDECEETGITISEFEKDVKAVTNNINDPEGPYKNLCGCNANDEATGLKIGEECAKLSSEIFGTDGFLTEFSNTLLKNREWLIEQMEGEANYFASVKTDINSSSLDVTTAELFARAGFGGEFEYDYVSGNYVRRDEDGNIVETYVRGENDKFFSTSDELIEDTNNNRMANDYQAHFEGYDEVQKNWEDLRNMTQSTENETDTSKKDLADKIAIIMLKMFNTSVYGDDGEKINILNYNGEFNDGTSYGEYYEDQLYDGFHDKDGNINYGDKSDNQKELEELTMKYESEKENTDNFIERDGKKFVEEVFTYINYSSLENQENGITNSLEDIENDTHKYNMLMTAAINWVNLESFDFMDVDGVDKQTLINTSALIKDQTTLNKYLEEFKKEKGIVGFDSDGYAIDANGNKVDNGNGIYYTYETCKGIVTLHHSNEFIDPNFNGVSESDIKIAQENGLIATDIQNKYCDLYNQLVTSKTYYENIATNQYEYYYRLMYENNRQNTPLLNYYVYGADEVYITQHDDGTYNMTQGNINDYRAEYKEAALALARYDECMSELEVYNDMIMQNYYPFISSVINEITESASASGLSNVEIRNLIANSDIFKNDSLINFYNGFAELAKSEVKKVEDYNYTKDSEYIMDVYDRNIYKSYLNEENQKILEEYVEAYNQKKQQEYEDYCSENNLEIGVDVDKYEEAKLYKDFDAIKSNLYPSEVYSYYSNVIESNYITYIGHLYNNNIDKLTTSEKERLEFLSYEYAHKQRQGVSEDDIDNLYKIAHFYVYELPTSEREYAQSAKAYEESMDGFASMEMDGPNGTKVTGDKMLSDWLAIYYSNSSDDEETIEINGEFKDAFLAEYGVDFSSFSSMDDVVDFILKKSGVYSEIDNAWFNNDDEASIKSALGSVCEKYGLSSSFADSLYSAFSNGKRHDRFASAMQSGVEDLFTEYKKSEADLFINGYAQAMELDLKGFDNFGDAQKDRYANYQIDGSFDYTIYGNYNTDIAQARVTDAEEEYNNIINGNGQFGVADVEKFREQVKQADEAYEANIELYKKLYLESYPDAADLSEEELRQKVIALYQINESDFYPTTTDGIIGRDHCYEVLAQYDQYKIDNADKITAAENKLTALIVERDLINGYTTSYVNAFINYGKYLKDYDERISNISNSLNISYRINEVSYGDSTTDEDYELTTKFITFYDTTTNEEISLSDDNLLLYCLASKINSDKSTNGEETDDIFDLICSGELILGYSFGKKSFKEKIQSYNSLFDRITNNTSGEFTNAKSSEDVVNSLLYMFSKYGTDSGKYDLLADSFYDSGAKSLGKDKAEKFELFLEENDYIKIGDVVLKNDNGKLSLKTENNHLYVKNSIGIKTEANFYNLRISEDGYLIDENGNYIEDENGNKIEIDKSKVKLDENGFIEYSKNSFADWFSVTGKSLGDGLTMWADGYYNLFFADGKLNSSDYANQYTMEYLNEMYSGFMTASYEIGTSIGNMLPSVIAGALITMATGGAGGGAAVAEVASSISKIVNIAQVASAIATMGLSVCGNNREQALQMGMENDEAWIYAIITAAAEVGLERVLGSIPFVSKMDDVAEKCTHSLVGRLSQMASEGLEEFTQDFVSNIAADIITDGEQEFDLSETFQSALKSGLYGAITGGIMNIGSISIDVASFVKYQNFSTLSTLMDNCGGVLRIMTNTESAQHYKEAVNQLSIMVNSESVQTRINAKINDPQSRVEYESYRAEAEANNSNSLLSKEHILSYEAYCENEVVSDLTGLATIKAAAQIVLNDINSTQADIDIAESLLSTTHNPNLDLTVMRDTIVEALNGTTNADGSEKTFNAIEKALKEMTSELSGDLEDETIAEFIEMFFDTVGDEININVTTITNLQNSSCSSLQTLGNFLNECSTKLEGKSFNKSSEIYNTICDTIKGSLFTTKTVQNPYYSSTTIDVSSIKSELYSKLSDGLLKSKLNELGITDSVNMTEEAKSKLVSEFFTESTTGNYSINESLLSELLSSDSADLKHLGTLLKGLNDSTSGKSKTLTASDYEYASNLVNNTLFGTNTVANPNYVSQTVEINTITDQAISDISKMEGTKLKAKFDELGINLSENITEETKSKLVDLFFDTETQRINVDIMNELLNSDSTELQQLGKSLQGRNKAAGGINTSEWSSTKKGSLTNSDYNSARNLISKTLLGTKTITNPAFTELVNQYNKQSAIKIVQDIIDLPATTTLSEYFEANNYSADILSELVKISDYNFINSCSDVLLSNYEFFSDEIKLEIISKMDINILASYSEVIVEATNGITSENMSTLVKEKLKTINDVNTEVTEARNSFLEEEEKQNQEFDEYETEQLKLEQKYEEAIKAKEEIIAKIAANNDLISSNNKTVLSALFETFTRNALLENSTLNNKLSDINIRIDNILSTMESNSKSMKSKFDALSTQKLIEIDSLQTQINSKLESMSNLSEEQKSIVNKQIEKLQSKIDTIKANIENNSNHLSNGISTYDRVVNKNETSSNLSTKSKVLTDVVTTVVMTTTTTGNLGTLIKNMYTEKGTLQAKYDNLNRMQDSLKNNSKKGKKNKSLIEKYETEKARLEIEINNKQQTIDNLVELMAEYGVNEFSPVSKLINSLKEDISRTRLSSTETIAQCQEILLEIDSKADSLLSKLSLEEGISNSEKTRIKNEIKLLKSQIKSASHEKNSNLKKVLSDTAKSTYDAIKNDVELRTDIELSEVNTPGKAKVINSDIVTEIQSSMVELLGVDLKSVKIDPSNPNNNISKLKSFIDTVSKLKNKSLSNDQILEIKSKICDLFYTTDGNGNRILNKNLLSSLQSSNNPDVIKLAEDLSISRYLNDKNISKSKKSDIDFKIINGLFNEVDISNSKLNLSEKLKSFGTKILSSKVSESIRTQYNELLNKLNSAKSTTEIEILDAEFEVIETEIAKEALSDKLKSFGEKLKTTVDTVSEDLSLKYDDLVTKLKNAKTAAEIESINSEFEILDAEFEAINNATESSSVEEIIVDDIVEGTNETSEISDLKKETLLKLSELESLNGNSNIDETTINSLKEKISSSATVEEISKAISEIEVLKISAKTNIDVDTINRIIFDRNGKVKSIYEMYFNLNSNASITDIMKVVYEMNNSETLIEGYLEFLTKSEILSDERYEEINGLFIEQLEYMFKEKSDSITIEKIENLFQEFESKLANKEVYLRYNIDGIDSIKSDILGMFELSKFDIDNFKSIKNSSRLNSIAEENKYAVSRYIKILFSSSNMFSEKFVNSFETYFKEKSFTESMKLAYKESFYSADVTQINGISKFMELNEFKSLFLKDKFFNLVKEINTNGLKNLYNDYEILNYKEVSTFINSNSRSEILIEKSIVQGIPIKNDIAKAVNTINGGMSCKDVNAVFGEYLIENYDIIDKFFNNKTSFNNSNISKLIEYMSALELVLEKGNIGEIDSRFDSIQSTFSLYENLQNKTEKLLDAKERAINTSISGNGVISDYVANEILVLEQEISELSSNIKSQDIEIRQKYNEILNFINSKLLSKKLTLDNDLMQAHIYLFANNYATLQNIKYKTTFSYEDSRTGGRSFNGKIWINTKFFTQKFKTNNRTFDILETIFHEAFHEMQYNEFVYANYSYLTGNIDSSVNYTTYANFVDKILRKEFGEKFYKDNYWSIHYESDTRRVTANILEQYVKQVCPNYKFENDFYSNIESDTNLFTSAKNNFTYEGKTIYGEMLLDYTVKNDTSILDSYPLLKLFYDENGTRRTINELLTEKNQLMLKYGEKSSVVKLITNFIQYSTYSLPSAINEFMYYTQNTANIANLKEYQSVLMAKLEQSLRLDVSSDSSQVVQQIHDILKTYVNSDGSNLSEINSYEDILVDLYYKNNGVTESIEGNNSTQVLSNSSSDSIHEIIQIDDNANFSTAQGSVNVTENVETVTTKTNIKEKTKKVVDRLKSKNAKFNDKIKKSKTNTDSIETSHDIINIESEVEQINDNTIQNEFTIKDIIYQIKSNNTHNLLENLKNFDVNQKLEIIQGLNLKERIKILNLLNNEEVSKVYEKLSNIVNNSSISNVKDEFIKKQILSIFDTSNSKLSLDAIEEMKSGISDEIVIDAMAKIKDGTFKTFEEYYKSKAIELVPNIKKFITENNFKLNATFAKIIVSNSSSVVKETTGNTSFIDNVNKLGLEEITKLNSIFEEIMQNNSRRFEEVFNDTKSKSAFIISKSILSKIIDYNKIASEGNKINVALSNITNAISVSKSLLGKESSVDKCKYMTSYLISQYFDFNGEFTSTTEQLISKVQPIIESIFSSSVKIDPETLKITMDGNEISLLDFVKTSEGKYTFEINKENISKILNLSNYETRTMYNFLEQYAQRVLISRIDSIKTELKNSNTSNIDINEEITKIYYDTRNTIRDAAQNMAVGINVLSKAGTKSENATFESAFVSRLLNKYTQDELYGKLIDKILNDFGIKNVNSELLFETFKTNAKKNPKMYSILYSAIKNNLNAGNEYVSQMKKTYSSIQESAFSPNTSVNRSFGLNIAEIESYIKKCKNLGDNELIAIRNVAIEIFNDYNTRNIHCDDYGEIIQNICKLLSKNEVAISSTLTAKIEYQENEIIYKLVKSVPTLTETGVTAYETVNSTKFSDKESFIKAFSESFISLNNSFENHNPNITKGVFIKNMNENVRNFIYNLNNSNIVKLSVGEQNRIFDFISKRTGLDKYFKGYSAIRNYSELAKKLKNNRAFATELYNALISNNETEFFYERIKTIPSFIEMVENHYLSYLQQQIANTGNSEEIFEIAKQNLIKMKQSFDEEKSRYGCIEFRYDYTYSDMILGIQECMSTGEVMSSKYLTKFIFENIMPNIEETETGFKIKAYKFQRQGLTRFQFGSKNEENKLILGGSFVSPLTEKAKLLQIASKDGRIDTKLLDKLTGGIKVNGKDFYMCEISAPLDSIQLPYGGNKNSFFGYFIPGGFTSGGAAEILIPGSNFSMEVPKTISVSKINNNNGYIELNVDGMKFNLYTSNGCEISYNPDTKEFSLTEIYEEKIDDKTTKTVVKATKSYVYIYENNLGQKEIAFMDNQYDKSVSYSNGLNKEVSVKPIRINIDNNYNGYYFQEFGRHGSKFAIKKIGDVSNE